MKASGKSLQNNSETITNEHENKEIPKESFRSPEEWQKLIDDLRLLQQYNNVTSKNIKFAR